MTSLTSTVADHAAASMSGWTEIVDIYLPEAITTPWGTLSTLRVASYPVDVKFFAPGLAPEPSGTRNSATVYKSWPLKRGQIANNSGEFNDTFTLSGSNVSGDWAAMLTDIDWRRARIMIRKVPIQAPAVLTYNDAVVLFTGFVRSARISLEAVTLSVSSDIGSFQQTFPSATFHPSCRFRYGDDFCTALKWTPANYKPEITCTSGSDRLALWASLTEDAGTEGSFGTDLVNALADSAITTSTALSTFEGYNVKSSSSDSQWFSADFSGANAARWGILTQGYWIIPDSQHGLANAALEPYISFDFGSAKTPRLWRVKGVPGLGREALCRLLLLFGSSNGSTWTHVSYFEHPAEQYKMFDWNVPNATACRYWRICMRTRWATGKLAPVLKTVEAYEAGRNYWRGGRVTFAADTPTAALRGISRTVSASYYHTLQLDRPLPAAPVVGSDKFSLARGCTNSWNHCCEHGNWANYGGWPDALGTELAADASGNTQDASVGGFAGAPLQRHIN